MWRRLVGTSSRPTPRPMRRTRAMSRCTNTWKKTLRHIVPRKAVSDQSPGHASARQVVARQARCMAADVAVACGHVLSEPGRLYVSDPGRSGDPDRDLRHDPDAG